jgi:tRNA U55 pseudouridine synthase TruB
VDIPPRQVFVHSLTLVDFSPPFFTIRVKTDGGLYVRTLVKVGSSLPFSLTLSLITHTHTHTTHMWRVP